MYNDLLAHVSSIGLSPALVLGLLAATLHLMAYGWYALEIFRGSTRPNLASWMMWLAGAWIEYVTYDAIDSHWSTAALPLSCFIGISFLTIITAFFYARKRILGKDNVKYEQPDKSDYWLVTADIGAYGLYIATGGAALANMIAVSTSVVTYIPIWKTTYRNGNEHPGPWVIWCLAYILMFIAVFMEGSDKFLALIFYPLYYFVLSLIVALLAIPKTKKWLGDLVKKFFPRVTTQ